MGTRPGRDRLGSSSLTSDALLLAMAQFVEGTGVLVLGTQEA